MSDIWVLHWSIAFLAFVSLIVSIAKGEGKLTIGYILGAGATCAIPLLNIWVLLYSLWEDHLPKVAEWIGKIFSITVWEKKKK